MISIGKKNRFRVSLEQTIDIWRMSRSERLNYLTQCRRAGRLSEWFQASVYPFRYLAYRWYRDIVSPKRVRYKLPLNMPNGVSLASEIHNLFAGHGSYPPRLVEETGLFAEVEQQMVGVFRLAGGAYFDMRKSLSDVQDIEHLHAYHRLYWAVRYARAVFRGHAGSLDALKRDLSAWMSQAWEGDVAVAAPYTTSERIASLCEVLLWLKQAGLPEFDDMVISVKQRIYLDVLHLHENLEIREDFNNHILNNARALYIASRMLGDAPQAGDWERQAFELWEKYFPLLILEDGSFAEQTSFYHVQMCRTALEYVLAARQSGQEIAPELFQRICKMFLQADDLIRSDGSLIRSGNTSPDHLVEDFWGLLPACYAHGLLPRPPRHNAITLLTLYYSKAVEGPQIEKRGKDIVLYPQGGWAFVTDTNLDMDLAVHGDPRRETHHSGDAGRGTFELWWKNVVLIREPGNPTYTLKARHWYLNGAGQNVSSLNDIPPGISSEYQPYLPLWYFARQNGEWKQLGGRGVKYSSRGLSRLDSSIVLTRTWFWRAETRLVMEESITGNGKYRFTSNLHLGDAPWRQEDASTFICPVGDSQVSMKLFLPQNIKIEVMPSKYAPEYGVEKDGRTLLLFGKVKLPFTWSVEWEFCP